MSRSNPQLTNPATRFFEWKGGEGHLEFYDKEQEKRINVPLPFSFLPLDELSTITGYNKQEKSGFWSNEVRNITKDSLTIRTKSGVKMMGTYKDEQGNVRIPKGANYTKSIYMAYKTKDGWEIGNLKASGSALSAWIEFSKTCKPENGKVTLTKGDMQESPVGEFYPPKLEYEASTQEEDSVAIQLDKELQVYLEQYLKQPPITDVEDEIVNGSQDDVTTDNIVQPSRSRSQEDKREDEEIREIVQDHVEEVTDEPVNLDDIPF